MFCLFCYSFTLLGSDYYNSNSSMAESVPTMFRVLSIIYFVLLLIGSLLLSPPPVLKNTSHMMDFSTDTTNNITTSDVLTNTKTIGVTSLTSTNNGSYQSSSGRIYDKISGTDIDHHRDTDGDNDLDGIEINEKSNTYKLLGNNNNNNNSNSNHNNQEMKVNHYKVDGSPLLEQDSGYVEVKSMHDKNRMSNTYQSLYHFNPKEFMSSCLAWHLATCFVTTALGGIYMSGTYKTYGLKSFDDEIFLTFVGSTSSIFSASGRIFWGALGDRIGAIQTLLWINFIFSIILGTYNYSAIWGELPFALWTFAVFFFEGGNFALYMPVTISVFGNESAGANYGIIFTFYSMFVVINITLLAGYDTGFLLASRLMGLLTFIGFINLLIFSRRIRQKRIEMGIDKKVLM